MHDANGKSLKTGDKVWIEGVISDCQAQPDYCNCTVKNVEPLPVGQVTFCVTVNTKQTVKCGEGCGDAPLTGFSFDDAKALALDVVEHLERHGDEYLSLASRTIKITSYFYSKQFVLALAEINSGVTDAKKLIAAIKADFNL
jgi:hypothetical protein